MGRGEAPAPWKIRGEDEVNTSREVVIAVLHNIRFRAALTALIIAVILPAACGGQEVRLRSGDRLRLEVPQRSEMGRVLVVDERGTVRIPTIGEIAVAGMTVSEAQITVFRRISEIYPSIREIILSLLGEEARRTIYVHGEVLNPGRFEFDVAPTVWEAVREAGGASADASLEAVRIIRAEDDGRRTSIVNLREAIDSGDLESLPELKPGDTVIIPRQSVPYQGSGSVKVIGAVVNPATYLLSDDKNLIDALLAAGGPSPNANLEDVKIIRRHDDGGAYLIHVDFTKYLDTGDLRQNPMIRPDDTVSVPRRNEFVRTLLDPRFLLAVVTAAATITALAWR
jgi:protein involved in polysaccharide export with SLBB domain